MWIFNKAGFFSVVQENGGSTTLAVRARHVDDLDRLREMYIPKLSDVVRLPDRDYPFRAFAHKEDFAEGMRKAAEDIDYTNFKSEIMKLRGRVYVSILHDVWEVARKFTKIPHTFIKR